MKTNFLAILFIAVIAMSINTSFAQGLAVNADGSAADPSAMLDVKSANKGFLANRYGYIFDAVYFGSSDPGINNASAFCFTAAKP